MGLIVTLLNGEIKGKIVGTFGKSGKLKVKILDDDVNLVKLVEGGT